MAGRALRTILRCRAGVSRPDSSAAVMATDLSGALPRGFGGGSRQTPLGKIRSVWRSSVIVIPMAVLTPADAKAPKPSFSYTAWERNTRACGALSESWCWG